MKLGSVENGIVNLEDNFNEKINEDFFRKFFKSIRKTNNPIFKEKIVDFFEKYRDNHAANILMSMPIVNDNERFHYDDSIETEFYVSKDIANLELKEFKKSTSNIRFITSKILHDNVSGIIMFPTFLKIDRLYGTVFFSRIFYSPEKTKKFFNMNKMCRLNNCRCDSCNVFIDCAIIEFIEFLENVYKQKLIV
jgi:hypothetical protein